MPSYTVTPERAAAATAQLAAVGLKSVRFDGVDQLIVDGAASTADPIMAALSDHAILADSLVASVDARRDEILAGGYEHDFGAPTGSHTLDCRTSDERIQWLSLYGIWNALPPSTPVEIVTAGNDVITVEAQAAAATVLDLGLWYASIIIGARNLKNALLAAQSTVEVEAIDLGIYAP